MGEQSGLGGSIDGDLHGADRCCHESEHARSAEIWLEIEQRSQSSVQLHALDGDRNDSVRLRHSSVELQRALWAVLQTT